MMEVLFFVGMGVVFLLVLALWAIRYAVPAVQRNEVITTEKLLLELQLDVPPLVVAKRIFAVEDWEYVRTHSRPEIERLFLKERTKVARAWLRRTRDIVGTLMRVRRMVVRADSRSSPLLELGVAVNYAVFLLLYGVLEVILWWGGPFFLRTMAGYASQCAQDLSYACGRTLLGLNGEQLSSIKRQWAPNAQW